MTCANSNCSDHTDELPLFACYGPCGNLFHSKCVGSNNSFMDKINSSNIAFWYCQNCRKISLSQFSFKLSSLKDELTRISKGFEDLNLNFNNILSTVKDIPTPVLVADNSTSTDDIAPSKTSNPNNKRSKKRGRDMTTSPVHAAPAPKRSSIRTQTKTRSTIIDAEPLLVSSNISEKIINDNEISQNSSEPMSNEPIDKQQIIIVPLHESSVTTHKSLASVPKPRVIFVSRLLPDTEPQQILDHLIASKIIANSSNIKCSKISKADSFVASFKIIAPDSLFEPICNSSWPQNTLVKEFVAPTRKKNSIKSVSGQNSKNLTGSASTTKM